MHDFKVASGRANLPLAKKVAEHLEITLTPTSIRNFSDGEIWVKFEENVRGVDLFIIQPTFAPADNLMELLIMIDAAKRASARRITAVIPYFGYARQDRKAKSRDPISAKLVANLITVAGTDRILTMDLHAPQLQGFFDIPLDHLVGQPILAHYFQERFSDQMDDVVVVSPDIGSVGRCRTFAEKLDVPLAIIDKRRPKANVSEIMNIIGDVRNKRVILVDDLIDTGGTIVNAANALAEIGAIEVFACCTHGVLSGPAIERIRHSAIKELVTLDTIPLAEACRIPQIRVLSVADIFAEAIERIYGDISISTLFTQF